jgi:hypothetical protein
MTDTPTTGWRHCEACSGFVTTEAGAIGDCDGLFVHPDPQEAVTRALDALAGEVTALAFLTPEDWAERRGGDPIARTINAVRDLIEQAKGAER